MKVENQDQQYSENELTWASLCHFSALMGLVWWVPISHNWIPAGHLIAPLVVWLIKRGTSPYIDINAKEALNFQMTVTFYALILGLLPLGFVSTYGITALAIFSACFAIKAGVFVSKGKPFRYPLILLRLLR